MTISVWDYRAEYEAERTDILAAVDRVMRSGRLILGESVRSFEHELATYCGAGHGVGVGSGTDALVLALRALGIQPGDEVITTSNTAIPTVAAIVTAGGTPRFVDIERGTYLMNVSQLDAVITDRTRCILPVHLFGQCVDMDRVQALADRHGLTVLEDCAQGTGAAQAGRRAGIDVTDRGVLVLSHQSTRHVRRRRHGGHLGRAIVRPRARGCGCTARKAATTRRNTDTIRGWTNCTPRFSGASSAAWTGTSIGDVRSPARYDDALKDSGLELPRTSSGNQHVYYLYVVRHPAREAIIRELAARDIVVNVSYRWPIHTMRAYAHPDYPEGSLPETEQAAKEIFSLPMYPSLTDAEQDRVCDALHEVLQTIGDTAQ